MSEDRELAFKLDRAAVAAQRLWPNDFGEFVARNLVDARTVAMWLGQTEHMSRVADDILSLRNTA